MIGHYLLSLTEEQEDRVLTEVFMPYATALNPSPAFLTRCVLDVARAMPAGSSNCTESVLKHANRDLRILVGGRYDNYCDRFGVARINNAIRDRILTNRLWRSRNVQEAYRLMHPRGLLFPAGSPV